MHNLTRDLPSLPEADLPPERHRQLREHLTAEVRRAATPSSSPRTGSWSLRPKFAGPAVAGALGLAVLTGVTVLGGAEPGTPIGPDGRATYAFAPNVNGDTTDGAVELLERVAFSTKRSSAPEDIRDNQYVYLRSTVANATVGEGEDANKPLGPPRQREVWLSVDGTRTGLLREPDAQHGEEEIPLERPALPGEPGYDSSTHYRHLQTLPTDPEAMLRWLYQVGDKAADRDRDQDAFVLVGDLLQESLVPPEVGAALYGAVARIPGVHLVPDAVNAAGRHGVAVVRSDAYNPAIRDELIFDEKSLELIGTRSVATRDADGADLGEVLFTSAIQERAVVDRPGQRPQG